MTILILSSIFSKLGFLASTIPLFGEIFKFFTTIFRQPKIYWGGAIADVTGVHTHAETLYIVGSGT